MNLWSAIFPRKNRDKFRATHEKEEVSPHTERIGCDAHRTGASTARKDRNEHGSNFRHPRLCGVCARIFGILRSLFYALQRAHTERCTTQIDSKKDCGGTPSQLDRGNISSNATDLQKDDECHIDKQGWSVVRATEKARIGDREAETGRGESKGKGRSELKDIITIKPREFAALEYKPSTSGVASLYVKSDLPVFVYAFDADGMTEFADGKEYIDPLWFSRTAKETHRKTIDIEEKWYLVIFNKNNEPTGVLYEVFDEY